MSFDSEAEMALGANGNSGFCNRMRFFLRSRAIGL